jgi:hypothetical protein
LAVAHSLRASTQNVLAGTQIGNDPGWIDKAVGRDADVNILDTGTPDTAAGESLTVLETYFWNRSVVWLAAVHPTAVCCIPQERAVIEPATGRIRAAVPSRYVLAFPDLGLDGTVLGRRPGMGLYRLVGPPRLGSLTTGVYADGWMAGSASYDQFAPLPPSVKGISVTLARTAWTGQSPASAARVRLVSRGRTLSIRRTSVTSGTQRSLSFAVPPTPFRIEVGISPTFAPASYGGTDTRQLGAQLTFALVPPPAP